VLDGRFSYDVFLAAADGDRKQLANELAKELTLRLQKASLPAQAVSESVDDLKKLGHSLWSFDGSDDFQVWCGDWTAPTAPFELIVEFTFREHEPRAVSVAFKPAPTAPVEERLLLLLRQFEKALPHAEYEQFRSLTVHREWGIALENLCQQLFEHDIPVGAAEIAEMKRLAEEMNLPSDTWDFLVAR
jgi:hypothetical protein